MNDQTPKNGAATQMPLFYSHPMPLDAKRHATFGMRDDCTFKFTSGINAVPVNLIEMPQVCHFYPIVFSADGTGTPIAILGVRDDENLFVNAKGVWAENKYIPAYIRRYPFIFSEAPGGEQLTLCVDMNTDFISEKAKPGQEFFTKDGKATQLSSNALEFCKSYHAAAQQTLPFGKALAEHGLLVTRSVELNIADNNRVNFSGFAVIDEEKFQKLDDKVFLDWRKKGYLPFIYAHLFSAMNWSDLTRRLAEKMQKAA